MTVRRSSRKGAPVGNKPAAIAATSVPKSAKKMTSAKVTKTVKGTKRPSYAGEHA